MPKIVVFFIISVFMFTACKNKEQKTDTEKVTGSTEVSIIKSEKPISRLNTASEEMISNWPEYQKFDELISQYQEISMSDALLNSVELAELARQLKDSIRLEELDIPEVKIRLNVLYSETLRLADMSTISTITAALVSDENDNVIDAYSALNLKINNMSVQEELNEEISKFVDEVLEETSSDSLDPKNESNQNN